MLSKAAVRVEDAKSDGSDVLRTTAHGSSQSRNRLILGDARKVLPSLAVQFKEDVQLIYVDPPYNRGEEFVHYSDRESSEQWRINLHTMIESAAPLLSETGSFWLHLDDAQQHHGRIILDKVFGPKAFVGTIIWQKRTSRDNRRPFSSMHDYIHVYAPCGPVKWGKVRNGVEDTNSVGFSNPDSDPRGPWRSAPMSAQDGHATAAQFYTVRTPTGVLHDPPEGRCWTYSRERLAELDRQGRVYWPRNGDGKPRFKIYQSEVQGLSPFTIWTATEVGDTAEAKKHIRSLFPGRPAFETPKPERLMDRIISIATKEGDRVLDFFLGSGTTAVAAERLGRRWVGIERERATMFNVTVPRLKSEVDATGRGFELQTPVAPETAEAS